MTTPRWRVLIADDDPTVGLLTRAALAGSPFEPTVVDNGIAALSELLSGAYALALLDVEMPGMDGVSVCRAIRAAHGHGLPLILVTGRTDPEFVADAQGLGADILGKPLAWAALPGYLQERMGQPPTAS